MKDITPKAETIRPTDAIGDLVPVPTTGKDLAPEAKVLMQEIDLRDTNSIISFGTKAQGNLQKVSQQMLEGTKNKDTGPAGESIRNMVTTMKGFSISSDDLRDKPTFIEKLMGKVAPIMRFKEKFANVQDQINQIAANLENHTTTLMVDVKNLDNLYTQTLDFYRNLDLYIDAGEARLGIARGEEIPAALAAVEAAAEDDKMVLANNARDLQAATDDLERRVHDLKLTRQVTMQSLPSIRLIQENDKSLINKIQSTLVNTVPLWETQLAQGLAINRAAQAADAVKGATDLTNELLASNAQNLRIANKAIRTEMERGTFDIAAIKKANDTLLATLDDSLKIANEGKAKRAESEKELVRLEEQLRVGLIAVKNREEGSSPSPM